MKFKVGDKVRCIESNARKGMGWKEYLEFTIDHFRPADSFTSAVYFPNFGHGVYEEALELVEEKQNNVEITRKQLKAIHDVACFAWQNKIEIEYVFRNPWGDTIELTQKEIDEMFGAATSSQKEVLEVIFGKQTKEIDLSKGNVDGLEIFNKNGTMDKLLMVVRSKKEYANKAFLLNGNYNWEIVIDSVGCKCLVPTRK